MVQYATVFNVFWITSSIVPGWLLALQSGITPGCHKGPFGMQGIGTTHFPISPYKLHFIYEEKISSSIVSVHTSKVIPVIIGLETMSPHFLLCLLSSRQQTPMENCWNNEEKSTLLANLLALVLCFAFVWDFAFWGGGCLFGNHTQWCLGFTDSSIFRGHSWFREPSAYAVLRMEPMSVTFRGWNPG